MDADPDEEEQASYPINEIVRTLFDNGLLTPERLIKCIDNGLEELVWMANSYDYYFDLDKNLALRAIAAEAVAVLIDQK